MNKAKKMSEELGKQIELRGIWQYAEIKEIYEIVDWPLERPSW